MESLFDMSCLTSTSPTAASGPDLWLTICQEAAAAAQSEPLLASFLHLTVLRHPSLEHVVAFHLSSKLSSPVMDARALYEVFCEAFAQDPNISLSMRTDIHAYYDRDPACEEYTLPLLYFKGFHATQAHRINHWLWQQGRHTLAYSLQNRASEVFGIDIHPGAKIGKGLMFDHGTGIVIGETAVLGDDISILHGVTLGGSGKESGIRHPHIGDGVMIGANAAVLGPIQVGHCAKIGAGSVVVADVAPYTTVVGVPAAAVGTANRHSMPSRSMDQSI